MKVLLVNGSPRPTGCTHTALQEVASALQEQGIETEIFWIGSQPIGGCIACGACRRTGECALGGTVNEFRQKAAGADGFVFGTPVHYASAGGNITAFMDRVFYSTDKAVFRHKPAAAVASARRAGTTATLDQINKYFAISEMPVISSRYWNMVHGNTPAEVQQDAEGLCIMRTLGWNMAYWLRCRQAAQQAGVLPPVPEEPVFTNFIR